jgi:hypothetical protein
MIGGCTAEDGDHRRAFLAGSTASNVGRFQTKIADRVVTKFLSLFDEALRGFAAGTIQ